MATPADTITLNEDDRSSHHQITQTDRGVDITQAEAAFNELSRQLSKASRLEKTYSNSSDDDLKKGLDIEKGADVAEPFDLREYLSSSNDANEAAGIKHKHVGVTWEDLEVEVVGGADMKVRSTLFDLNPGIWSKNALVLQFYVPTFGREYLNIVA